jgi:holo-[acyl-carrier protein] synthase
MTLLRTGIDILEIKRLDETLQRHGKRFLERVYTRRELDEVGSNLASLAARFAAKEAVSKALLCGFGPIAWRDVEVVRGPNREPVLLLHGEAARRAAEQGLSSWSLSLTHCKEYAAAVVVMMG